MANRTWKDSKVLEQGVVKLFGTLVIGSTGAITSQSCKGFSVAKTASETGRYTVTLEDKYNGFLGANVTLEGAADTAFASAGLAHFVRNVAVSASVPKLDLQISSAVATPADIDLPSGTKVYIELTLKNSSAW